MNKALLASAACAALGLAATAQASVVATTVDKGVPTNGTVSATGFHAYVLHLHSDSGNITAVDFSGTKGITGSIVERWTSSGGDGTYDTPTPGFSTVQGATATSVNYDSHFLGVASNYVVGSALGEDATIPASGGHFGTFPNNSDAAGVGQGTFLRGAYGVVGAVQSADLDVAYVVIPQATGGGGAATAQFSAQVATANGTFDISGPIPIPEPMSASLLGLGALGLISRRRRA